MPLYRFKGIDVFGTIHRGKLQAPTEQHLADFLHSEGIVILTVKSTYRLRVPFITSHEKIIFYRTISQLLHSGVLLPDALEYVAMNAKGVFFQDCAYALSKKISSGQTFSQALVSIPSLTSPTINFMIHAGEQAGHLEKTSAAIANYLERTKNFRKNLLSALFMPIMTIIALIALVAIISQIMLPRLLSMMSLFNNKKKRLNDTIIFKILHAINMRFFLYFLLGIAFIALFFFLVNKFKYGRILLHRFILRIPGVKTILIYAIFSRMFFMLSLLLKSGVTLVESLVIINTMTVFEPIKNRLDAMTDSTKNGMMLSAGLSRYFGLYDTYASLIIRVAEKNGSITDSCEQISNEYDNKIKKIMEYMVMIIQPVVIVVIGLFVVFLMVALYSPLVEFSMSI